MSRFGKRFKNEDNSSSINGFSEQELKIEREPNIYEGLTTDKEKEENNVNPVVENASNLVKAQSSLGAMSLALDFATDKQEEQLDNNLDYQTPEVPPELVMGLGLSLEEIQAMRMTEEELGLIIDMRAEVDAALGLSEEDSDLNNDLDYSSISPEMYSRVTGRDLETDFGIINPDNQIGQPQVDNNISNDLENERNDLANELFSETEPSQDYENKPDKPAYRSSNTPFNTTPDPGTNY